MLQKVSQEFGKNDTKGPHINGKLTKIFQDLKYGIVQEENIEKLLKDNDPQEKIKGGELLK